MKTFFLTAIFTLMTMALTAQAKDQNVCELRVNLKPAQPLETTARAMDVRSAQGEGELICGEIKIRAVAAIVSAGLGMTAIDTGELREAQACAVKFSNIQISKEELASGRFKLETATLVAQPRIIPFRCNGADYQALNEILKSGHLYAESL